MASTPEKIIDQARRLRNEDIVDVDEATSQFVLFLIGDYRFATEASQIKEIIAQTRVTFVPGLPDYFLGLIHLRGDLEAVVDLGKILGLGTTGDSDVSRILVIRNAEVSVGVRVDYVNDIVDIPSGRISKNVEFGSSAARTHLLGQFEYRSSVVSIVDLLSVLRSIQPVSGRGSG